MNWRKSTSNSAPDSSPQLRELLVRRHAVHRPAVHRAHVVAGVPAPAHPRHRVAAGGRQLPQHQPALHALDLVQLRLGEVEAERPDLRVVAAGLREVGHLHRLQVVGGHVARDTGVHRVRGRRPLAAQREPQPAAEQQEPSADAGEQCCPQPAGSEDDVPAVCSPLSEVWVIAPGSPSFPPTSWVQRCWAPGWTCPRRAPDRRTPPAGGWSASSRSRNWLPARETPGWT